MAKKRLGQRWILDALLGVGGWDLLNPDAGPAFQQLGYNPADTQRIFSMVKSSAMMPKAWGTVGQEVESKARYWETRGHATTAADLYARAALIYGRTQYACFKDDPRKEAYFKRAFACFRRMMEYAPHRIERAAIPFEGKEVYGLFEAPEGARNVPCMILLPGMDMFKEDWHRFISEYVVPRGWAAFAVDGPGQGETLLRGLKVTLGNYERAASAVIDWLSERPEVDPERIVLLGVGMGSYWGTRIAGTDHRLKAVATALACYGPKAIILNRAQPNFKENYMYMSGIDDESEFDRMAEQMVVDGLASNIECPFLMVQGELDELTTLEDTFEVYRRVRAPKEIWVFDREFHPLGPTANEYLTPALDWLAAGLGGRYEPGYARELSITRDGRYMEGSAEPPRWQPDQREKMESTRVIRVDG